VEAGQDGLASPNSSILEEEEEDPSSPERIL